MMLVKSITLPFVGYFDIGFKKKDSNRTTELNNQILNFFSSDKFIINTSGLKGGDVSLSREENGEEIDKFTKMLLNEIMRSNSSVSFNVIGTSKGVSKLNMKFDRAMSGSSKPESRLRGSEVNVEARLIQNKISEPYKIRENGVGPVEKAVQDYQSWCQERNIHPHQSKVHTFADTVQQARLLTIPAKDPQEAYKFASLTFYSHLFDDLIDDRKDFPSVFGGTKTFDSFLKRADPTLKSVAKQTLRFADTEKGRRGIKRTLIGMVDGALIQQARNTREQKEYTERFKQQITYNLKDEELRRDIEKLHPLQFAVTAHVVLDGWVGLETDNSNADLATLQNLWFAPMLYSHDKDEEVEHEGFKIKHGRHLSDNGVVADRSLIPLIDVADRYIAKMPDYRAEEHLQQMKIAYTAFRNTLSVPLQKRYEKSLGILESTLHQRRYNHGALKKAGTRS